MGIVVQFFFFFPRVFFLFSGRDRKDDKGAAGEAAAQHQYAHHKEVGETQMATGEDWRRLEKTFWAHTKSICFIYCRTRVMSQRHNEIYYVLLQLVAVVAACCCSGQTRQWKISNMIRYLDMRLKKYEPLTTTAAAATTKMLPLVLLAACNCQVCCLSLLFWLR